MSKFFIALFLLSTSAFADEYKTYLVVNAASYHFNREATKQLNLNEINPGIGFEISKKNIGFAIGSYYNSLHKTSNYLLASYTPINFSNVKIGGVAGGITGYPRAAVIPAIGLLAAFNFKSFGANLIVTPDVPKLNVYGFVGVQLRFRL